MLWINCVSLVNHYDPQLPYAKKQRKINFKPTNITLKLFLVINLYDHEDTLHVSVGKLQCWILN